MYLLVAFFMLVSCSPEEQIESSIENSETHLLKDNGIFPLEVDNLFPGANWSIESAVSTPGDDGCVTVETRLYMSYGDTKILMAISQDKFCGNSTHEDTIEIGSCQDGYYSDVLIINVESDNLQCITELLAEPQVKDVYDAHLEETKNLIF